MSEHPHSPQYEEAFLISTADSIEAGMIEALLTANDIPVLKKYRESGGYLKIVMGDSMFGVDLFVPAELLEKAVEIIENSREASKDEAFPYNVIPEETNSSGPDKSDDIDLTEQEQRISRKRRLVSWIVILLFTPGLLWLIIFLIRLL